MNEVAGGMIKFFKRLFCKHERAVYVRTDLIRQDDNSYVTAHVWKCRNCGKVIK